MTKEFLRHLDTKKIIPESPDGSGSGIYDPDMSFWAHRPVYRTASGEFFYPEGKEYVMMSHEQLKSAQKYLKEYGRPQSPKR